jgi:hypothetical protein
MPVINPKFRIGDFVKFKSKDGYDWGNIIDRVWEPIEGRWIYRLDTDEAIYYFEENLTLVP